MTWIKTIPKEEAGEDLVPLFERFRIEHGRIFTPYEPMTNNPKALLAVVGLNDAIRFGRSPLTRVHRELIATYVSFLNRCTF
ncbi:MAG: hypothetical protein NVS1B1_00220 [Candidatus Limnocylindrales bacterium]